MDDGGRERALVAAAAGRTLEATAARRLIEGVVGSDLSAAGGGGSGVQLVGLVGEDDRGIGDALAKLGEVARQQSVSGSLPWNA